MAAIFNRGRSLNLDLKAFRLSEVLIAAYRQGKESNFNLMVIDKYAC